MDKIYLAVPYTGLEEQSFKAANKVAAQLMKEGDLVYSPISHSHPIANQEGLPTDYKFWYEHNKAFIEWADYIYFIVLGIEGYDLIDNSKGCKVEKDLAMELDKKIRYYILSNG